MQLLGNKKWAVLFAAAIVLSSLGMANYIGWLRLKPEVAAVAWIADRPDYESHLVNMHHRATMRTQPGSPDAYLPIYDVQNPGFFLLVAELFVRAGATTPFPLEILSIVLFNVGAICLFFWVYVLFDDLLVAAFATAFLALSQFFLFFPGVTHTMPYEFVFFNIMLLLYVLYLKTSWSGYFVGALVAMFLTCMNYWFYYMSSWLIMVGLWWQYRGRPRLGEIAIISTPPVAAAAFTAAMVMTLSGGIKQGGLRLLDIFVARTVDARIPGGTWYPDQRFMLAGDWVSYPSLVVYRLEWAYNFDFYWFSLAAACAAAMLWVRQRDSLVSALILFAGGFSWYYVMFQHTHIHHFVGQYSFMAVCAIFGLIISETITSVWAALCLIKSSGMGDREMQKSAGLRVGAAIIMVVVTLLMLRPYALHTYSLIRQTLRISTEVEAKYQQAVEGICRDHQEITLSALQSASKDWGFEWRSKFLADTNQMPKCPG